MPAVAIPKELQQAVNAVALPIMAKFKIKGPVTVTIDPPPGPPAALRATPSLSGIALSWAANTENDLAASPYRIYRSTDGLTYALLAGPQAGTTYADAAARAGTPYFYEVTASDAAGNESAPAAASATRPSPPAVTNFTARPTSSPHDVALSWAASIDPAHAGYPLYRSVNGGGFSLIATPTATTYIDPVPAQNVPLIYRIFDANNLGDSGTGTDVSTLIDTTAPAALLNLRVTAVTPTSIAIAWDASAAPDLAGYKVERSVNGAGFTTLSALQSPTTYTDNTAAAGSTYTFRVTAIDNSNNVSQPATVTLSIAPPPPAAPTGLTATVSTSGILLGWIAVAGAVRYGVSSATSAGGPFNTIGSPTAASYNDTAAAIGITTFYRVWAIDSLNQAGPAATVSAIRPAVVGTGFPRVGTFKSGIAAASVTVSQLGHFTHFSAFHLVGVAWESKRFQWSLGEVGTQIVVDPRTGLNVDLSTQQEGPKVVFQYTSAGQKNVSVTVTNEDGSQQTYSTVVNVPPSTRAMTLVGPSRTIKTWADVKAHLADNTEWIFDAATYTVAADIRLGHNMVFRAATPGTVILHSTLHGNSIFTTWPGQTVDATVDGIAFDSDFAMTTNGDGTPYKLSQSGIITCKGDNVGFSDCTVAVTGEAWKGSEVDLVAGTSFCNGFAMLRCRATDPIGIGGRTFWIEGYDVAVVGGVTLNSMNESPMRNANTSAGWPYVAYNDVKQTLDPVNHRTGAKAAGTFRACTNAVIRCNKFGGGNPKGGDFTFDPHTGDAHDSHILVEQNLIYGQVTIQGNVDHLLIRNNVMDRRGGNNTGIGLTVNGLPIDALTIVNNTMIGDSIHQPLLYVGGYNPAALPHLLTGLVVANNLIVNPNLVPISGNTFSNSITIVNQDVSAIAKIGGNIHPDVKDWHGGKKLVYVGNSTLSPDYMLTIDQWDGLMGAADIQAAVAISGQYAPPASSHAASAGIASGSFGSPQTDYYGAAGQAGRVGAVNPV